MIRNLKVLGLALVCLLAAGSVASSPAVAQILEFEAEKGAQTITGTSVGEKIEFSITSEQWVVTCKEAHFNTSTYTIGEAQAEIHLTPEFKMCSKGSVGAEFNTNGCDYRVYAVTTVESKRKGVAELVCPSGKVMDIRIALFGTLKCTVTVIPEKSLGWIVLDNENPGVATERDIKATIELSKMLYEEQAGTGFGACANGPTEGSYLDTVTLKARTHEGNEKGLWID